MEKSKLNKRAVRVFSICLILMLVLPIISVFFVVAVENFRVNIYHVQLSYGIVGSGNSQRIGSYTANTTYGISLDRGQLYAITSFMNGGYRIPVYYYLNGVRTDLSHDPNNPTIIEADVNDLIFSADSRFGNSQSLQYFIIKSLGYTLTFNSQGGSAINPIEGIEEGETILLGDSTGYFPQYIPTKEYSIFAGWSTESDGTAIKQITVNADTILYALWVDDPEYQTIYFNPNDSDLFNYFKLNRGDTTATSSIRVRQGDTITFYFHYGQPHTGIEFDGDLIVDGIFDTKLTGTYKGTGDWEYTYTVPSFSVTITPDYIQLLKYNIKLWPENNSEIYDYVHDFELNGSTYDIENSPDLYTRSGTTHTVTFKVRSPYVVTDASYYWSLNDYDICTVRGVTHEDNSRFKFYNSITIKFTVNHNGTLYITNSSITDYDITSRDPIVVYDESGDVSWAMSEVGLLDTDWSEVADDIPGNLGFIFDGVYNLQGFSIIVPLIMMVSFALWFLRRS